MGWSVAILAFGLENADLVLREMEWEITDHQVGEPIDPETISIEELMSPEFQAAGNPHFSAAKGNEHFFLYTSLKEMKYYELPDFAKLSRMAPFTVQIVVETNQAATIERWEDGEVVWSLAGASGYGYEAVGQPPIDLTKLSREYRTWFGNRELDAEDLEYMEPEELVLPKSDDDLIRQEFKGFLDHWFAETYKFAYAGDHPPLFRLKGDLPIVDTRNSPSDK